MGNGYRTLTVADGIPQSYVSGIVQDGDGFMWIATRDGLARYDGRKFKVFRHQRQDSLGLADNIITKLFLDNDSRLWISYESGELDIMDTKTAHIRHLSAQPDYSVLKNNLKPGNSLLQHGDGKIWVLGKIGELYIIDMVNERIASHTASSLFPSLGEQRITGIAKAGENILLVLDKGMVYLDAQLAIKKHVPFSFSSPNLYNPTKPWKDNSPLVRKNGEVIIPDENRLILYRPQRQGRFTQYTLREQKFYVIPHLVADRDENIIIAHEHGIYRLDTDNRFGLWARNSEDEPSIKSAIWLDRSGLLWTGTNGYGVQLYDIYLNQMPKIDYELNFPYEVQRNLRIPDSEIKGTFLYPLNPYFFRWTRGKDSKIWMSKSGADPVDRPNILYYDEENGHIHRPIFNYRNLSSVPNLGLDALATSPTGKLWGLDHDFKLVFFDEKSLTATVHPVIAHHFFQGKLNEINGMLMDDEDTFYISSALGLMKYHLPSGQVVHYLQQYPSLHPLAILQDPDRPNLLWLGTYSDGLVCLDKKTGEHRFYGEEQGLPNNTVYAILPDKNGRFWCSSNKGVFSFDSNNGQVTTYSTQGVKPLNEFNRFHYFQFADGQLAFGATEGYTLFYPQELQEDSYNPAVALTELKVNNRAVAPVALGQPLNQLQELHLPYDQNFLSFEFAALQFNAPEKLQYRYKLEGLDKEWVERGTENTATYTTVPPGRYTLWINASNTSGKWSSHVKKLAVVISPPFWQTWWFRLSGILIITGIAYLIVRLRIRHIRKKAQQKIDFEREAMELEAQALRLQMNPHFIFNCLNSIKALIQEDEKRSAVIYLTTFSKLIRNQLNNDQRQISLKEELDTIRLYLELEALRFRGRIRYTLETEPNIDLYQIKTPPLLLQPFVENAIIHGILPLDTLGEIRISVLRQGQNIVCQVDDNGIGRTKSAQLKRQGDGTHRSKGTLLVQQRVNLHNALKEKNIDIVLQDKVDGHGMPCGTRVTLTFKSQIYD